MTTQTNTQTPNEHIETPTTQDEHIETPAETIITNKKPRFELGIRHRIIIVAAALVVSLMVYLILPSKKVAVTPAAVNQAENVTPDPTTTTPSTPSTNPSTDGYAVNSNSPTPPPLAAPDVTSATLTPATPNLPNTPTPPPANPMTDQLTNINQQLQTIETTLSSQGNSQVQAEIHNVITEIGNMMSDSTTTLNTAIQSSEQSLASQLNGMQGQLSNIQQLSQPGSYIDPSNLPFTLLFIDNVGGQNVVTVSYNNISTPLSTGQSLAGWKLTTADYASQYAVFQNDKDQLVKVSNTGAQ